MGSISGIMPEHNDLQARCQNLSVFFPKPHCWEIVKNLTAREQKKTRFDLAIKAGHITWQRPTLTEPIALLPLALHRFTSVFEMGTGGSNALWSPGDELWPGAGAG